MINILYLLFLPLVSMVMSVGIDVLSCVRRSAGAVQSAQEALAHSLQSEQGEDAVYPEYSLPTHENEIGYQKVNGLSDHEVKLEKTFSGELLASAFPEYPTDTLHNMLYDATVEVAGSLPKYDEQALRPSSPSVAGMSPDVVKISVRRAAIITFYIYTRSGQYVSVVIS